MSTTLFAIIVLVPLILIIVLTIYLMQRHSRKQAKRIKEQFTSFCNAKGFQPEYLMHRQNRIAALSLQNNQIAWVDPTAEPMKDPVILSIERTQKQVLEIKKTNNGIQKIVLYPAYKTPVKGTPDIVFYDWMHDNESRLNTYMEQAQEWEKALNSV